MTLAALAVLGLGLVNAALIWMTAHALWKVRKATLTPWGEPAPERVGPLVHDEEAEEDPGDAEPRDLEDRELAYVEGFGDEADRLDELGWLEARTHPVNEWPTHD